MKNILVFAMGLLIAGSSWGTVLSVNQTYQLNNQAGGLFRSMSFGDKISNLASGKIRLGDSAGLMQEVTPSGDVTISNTGVTAIGAGKVTEAMHTAASSTVAGLELKRYAHLIWDPSAVAAHRTGTAAAFGAGYGASVPANSLITNVYFYTKTLASSTGNNGQIALNCLGAGDLLNAIDPDATSGLFAAGAMSSGEITGTQLAHSTKIGLAVAAGCTPTFTVSVNNFLTGRTHIYIEYVPLD